MRKSIRILRNGHIREIGDLRPDEMLLDYLRLRERVVGTKEGCAEGDCGACTVAIGRYRNGGLVYEPVNACIQPLGCLDATEVVTVEDLAGPEGTLHPVQAAMVEHHASQCGFCTPGFVMSLFALYHATGEKVERATVDRWIAGNLCRCTGYRPIIDAAIDACDGAREDRFGAAAEETGEVLRRLADGEDIIIGSRDGFFAAPATMDALVALYEQNPDATIVAGATDVGLWVTKRLRAIRKVIYVGRVIGFDRIEDVGDALLIGAGATFEAAELHLAAIDPDLGELMTRIGGKQVRAVGTIGGNIANGSPIGDMPPALIALDATIELRKGERQRTMPLEAFFIDYGKQNRQPGEVLTGILVPKLKPGTHFRAYKVSKRFDQDISAVTGAFRFTVEGGVIREARIAFGGMAGTPRRAAAAEQALVGYPIRDSQHWARAFVALKQDFAPIDDHRASARYRTETAQALLGKALIEIGGTATTRTRLVGRREGKRNAAA